MLVVVDSQEGALRPGCAGAWARGRSDRHRRRRRDAVGGPARAHRARQTGGRPAPRHGQRFRAHAGAFSRPARRRPRSRSRAASMRSTWGWPTARRFSTSPASASPRRWSREQSKALKRRWRAFAYAIGLMRAARAMRPFVVDLEIDGGARWSAAVHQVSVANGRHHGGGLTVAEDAAIDDGKLDLYLVHPGTFWQLFACLTHLRFGLMQKPAVLDRHRATRVSSAPRRPRRVECRRQIRHHDAGRVRAAAA